MPIYRSSDFARTGMIDPPEPRYACHLCERACGEDDWCAVCMDFVCSECQEADDVRHATKETEAVESLREAS